MGISADGVERETGLLAISAKTPLQVSESSAVDLQRVDAADFPRLGGQARTIRWRSRIAMCGRATNSRSTCGGSTRRRSCRHSWTARSSPASWPDDGQMMTEMALSVRNNGRQFLEVALPAGANVWSAFVAGQPVRPSLRVGKLLLPIQQSGRGRRRGVRGTDLRRQQMPFRARKARSDSPRRSSTCR